MRVAVASWTIRYAGGVEAYLEHVIPAMRGAGIDVGFFHEVDVPSDRARIDIGDVAVFNAAAAGVEAAAAALQSWKPDVMYMHGLRNVRTFAHLTSLAPSVSFVHAYFGTCVSGSKTHTRPSAVPCDKRFGPMCLVHYFPRRCGGRSPVTMLRLYRKEARQLSTLQKQRAVITHSAHMQGELAAHGVNADLIPYAVSTSIIEESNTVKCSDVLFAGRMDALKGGLLLLDALPLIRRQLNGPIRVVFAGDGPERRRWEERAAAVANSDADLHVTFSGWCSDARLADLMRETRLLAVPSVWPEPFGSVGMAAARQGVPAAAFAVGGIPQWLHENVNGHLASGSPPTAEGLAGAIVRCLGEPQHYRNLCAGARRMAASFTMDKHLPELVRIFERVVDGPR